MLKDEVMFSLGFLKEQAFMWNVLLDLLDSQFAKESIEALEEQEKLISQYAKHKLDSIVQIDRKKKTATLYYELEEFELLEAA